MRNFSKLTMIGAIVAAMFFNAYSADAQSRRTTTTNSNSTTAARSSSSSSNSDNKASRTAGTVKATSRSNGTSANSRNNASVTNPGSSSQNRRTTTSGTTRSNTSSTSSNDRNKTTASGTAGRTSGTSNRAAGTVTATHRTDNTSAGTERTASQQQTGSAARGGIRATSHAGLTSSNEMQERSASASRTSSGVTASANKATGVTRQELNYAGKNSHMNMDDHRNLNRVPPRDRDYMTYDRPGMFYGRDPHYFGYRISTLPPSYKRIRHMGIDYYCYNNIYYRHYGTYYVVCRPPFGVTIDYVFTGIPFRRVRFSYYHNVYHAYDRIDSNYRTIVEQNRTIAQNNARIAQQNRTLALNSSRASSSYEIATALGLVQSYAGINTDYYYEDGVFYTVNKKGKYEVIVPPAGALVDELPDDYDVLVLNGVEYYKVDDTVYRLVLVDGVPCLEVLGQMYGSMARQYNYYYR